MVKIYKTWLMLLVLAGTVSIASAQNAFQWRGINRQGIYNEKGLQTRWPETGPPMLWFNEDLGTGYGSPAFSSNKLFINGEIDSTSYLFAYDLSGKLIWKSPNGFEYTGKGYGRNFPGARSTPTIAGDLIYACSGNGRVACFDKNNGKEKWAVEMTSGLEGIMPEFGYSESLLIDGDMIFCSPGGTGKNLAGLNRFTGKTIWTSKALSDSVSYCSPMLISLPQRKVLVNFTNNYLLGLDALTGELLWSHKQENVKYQQQCNTPLYSNGCIYYVAGDGNGAVKLELSADGKTIKEVWRNSLVKNSFNGFVMLGNHLFSTDRTQKLKCIDANTGVVTDSLKITKGSLIAANNMLYCYSDNGDVQLIKLTGTTMEIVSKFKCNKGTKEHFSHPVISNGVMYIRHGKALIAYDIKEK